MTRAEHLAWAKERALEYVDRGELVLAQASLISDLGKHPETGAIPLEAERDGLAAVLSGDPAQVRQWIAGFH
jgi:hypothetical protein